MGQLLTRSAPIHPPQVVLVGLDSSGKSTLLTRLLTGELMETSPTVGFNVGTLELDQKDAMTLWDLGGQPPMRTHWRQYLDGCRALVFVVDSSDPGRMPEARAALKRLLSEEQLNGVPLMVLANKKDLDGTLTIREVSRCLELDSYLDRSWEIQSCSGRQGLGLQQAFISVARLIKKS
ncbi:unnamed protein product [Gadus morhua 'NCC']